MGWLDLEVAAVWGVPDVYQLAVAERMRTLEAAAEHSRMLRKLRLGRRPRPGLRSPRWPPGRHWGR